MSSVKAPPRVVLLGALLAMLLTLIAVPSPADAATTVQTLSSSGSQNSGRWQTFNLNSNARNADSLTVTATWSGSGDVNLFLRDASGRALEASNGSDRPEILAYSGSTTPVELAVLVSSGSASYSVTIEEPDGGSPGPGPSTGGDYPGQPDAGDVLWGASIEGNSDPYQRHERHAGGDAMGVRRTFFNWNQRSSGLVSTASKDVAAGRTPWVSVTTPGWSQMASGNYDGQIDQMLRGLDDLNGPVWLTVHHEPEGGGGVNSSDDPAGPSGHLAMNRRVRQRMNALGVDNVALAPILMAWTWDPLSGRNVNSYWDSSVYDFVGVDIYAPANESMLRPVWFTVRQWAANRGVDIAVGEWSIPSNNSTAAQHMREFYWHAAGSSSDGDGARVAALAYFDSDNHSANMTIYSSLRNSSLTTFRSLLSEGPSATQ